MGKNIFLLSGLLVVFGLITLIAIFGLSAHQAIFGLQGLPPNFENWIIIILSIGSMIKIVIALVKE